MDEWTIRRESKITYQVTLDPEKYWVSARWGRVRFLRRCRVLCVFVTYRSRSGGDWERRVSVVSDVQAIPVLSVPGDLGSVPGWLEDIIQAAEGMQR